jgi:diacylglycerol O-acyltransferase / wax synthase
MSAKVRANRHFHASQECPSEPLGPIDRTWLEMGDAKNPMVVSAILELEGPVRMAMLRRVLTERLLRYHRFRQRVDGNQDPPQWVTDAHFKLDYHLRVSELKTGASDKELRGAIARELAAELDRGLPLWRITLFRRRHGGIIMLFRGHHAMGDGMAFLHVLMNCTDRNHHAEPDDPSQAAAVHHGPLGSVIDRLESVNVLLEGLYDVTADDLRHPSHVLEQLRDGHRALVAAGRVLALPDDNPLMLRHPLSGHRAVGWTGGIPFAPIHRLAKARKVKVNDVFITALAGAFGHYLREAGGLVREDQNLRVSIPVNLRSENDRHMGNYFGLILADLPVGIVDARQRLRVVSERMNLLKHSPEARAVLIALAAAGYLPVPMEKRLVNLVSGKAVAVVSNLPGPKRALRIGGARLANMVFWPPQAGRIGIGISLFSYAGQVTVGVTSDIALVDDPQHLVALFESELRDMVEAGKRRK